MRFFSLLLPLLCSLVFAQTSKDCRLVSSNGGAALALGSAILDDATVNRHLSSGLTTTFRVEVRVREPGKKDRLQILALALRYELWEEKFLLTGFDGQTITARETLESKEALQAWWRDARLPVFGNNLRDGTAYRIKVEVIPFSAGEREAAADWVNSSLGESQTNSASQSNDLGARILSTIVATSFKSRVLQIFTYKGKKS